MRRFAAAGICVVLALAGLSPARGQEQRIVWPFRVQGAISSSAALSPDNQTVFVGVENRFGTGYVVAIDVANPNREKWLRELPERVRTSSPAVSADGSLLYIGCDDNRLYALNAGTGAIRFSLNTGADVESSPAIAANGTVYFGADDAKLHAATPELTELWTFNASGPIDSSPAIGPDGTIYFGSWDKNVYAVTPAGTLKWQFVTEGRISASPAIGADGTIYVGSYDHRLYALAPNGTKKWDYLTNDEIWSSPAIGADGTIYFASADTNFYALNPGGSDELRVKWKASLNATTSSTAAVRGDGTIIVGVDGSRLVAFNPDGSKRFDVSTGTGDIAEASPLIAPDGSIYLGFLDGILYKFAGNGSPLSQYSTWPAFRHDGRHTGRALATGAGQLLNISARAPVAGSATLIAGLAITGASEKVYLLRGVGPTLAQFGVLNPMNDPRLDMFSGGVPLDLKNDNWGEVIAPGGNFGVADTAAAVGAFPLPVGSKDAAIVSALGPGLYTAHVSSVDGQGGVVLVEAYDVKGAGDSTGRIVNLSTRGQVGTNGNVLIPGVVVGGSGIVRLLVRAVGPGLAPFGVSGVLARPQMRVFSNSQQVLATNTGWTSDGLKNDLVVAARQVGAFALTDGSADCALILDAMPGAYTIQVAGVGGTTGEALVEIYVLP